MNFSQNFSLLSLIASLALSHNVSAELVTQYNDQGITSIQFNGREFYLGTGQQEHRPIIDRLNEDDTYSRILQTPLHDSINILDGGRDITRNYEVDADDDGNVETISIRTQFEQTGNTLLVTWTFTNPADNLRPIRPDPQAYKVMDLGFTGYAEVNRQEFLLGRTFSITQPPATEMAFEDFTLVITGPDSLAGEILTLLRNETLSAGDFFFSYINDFEDGAVPLQVGLGFDGTHPIAPGESKSIKLKFTFATTEPELEAIRAEAVADWNLVQPVLLDWPDRRPFGQYIHGSAAGVHWAGNPFGWFNNPNGRRNPADTEPLYVNGAPTPASLLRFEEDLMDAADEIIANLELLDAQGIVFWDIEGQQNVHPTTFLGDPRRIVDAPEMEADPDNNGVKTIDEFINRFTDLGYRVGFTIRPQRVVPNPNFDPESEAYQARDPYINKDDIPENERVDELKAKIAYASARWGATVFYIDSWPSISLESLQLIRHDYPDILLLPEWSALDTYAYSAPFRTDINLQYMTPDPVRETYPEAFSVTSYGGSPYDIELYLEMKEKQKEGDSFLFRAWGGFKDEKYLIDRFYTENAYEDMHGDLEGQSVANLITTLGDADKSRVYRAVLELSKIEGNQAVLDALLQVFLDHTGVKDTDDWIIARLACEAVGVPGNTSAIPTLQAASVAAGEDTVSQFNWFHHHEYWALQALARIGGSTVATILQDTTNSAVSHRAAYALEALSQGDFGDSEATLINRLLSDPVANNRATAGSELELYTSDAVKNALIAALWDDNENVVRVAINGLGKYDLDSTALGALYQARQTIKTFEVEDAIIDNLKWRITQQLPKNNAFFWNEGWVDVINAVDIFALDLVSWWRHIPRESYGGYRATYQAFGDEPGIGWIFDPYWPYVFNVADYRGQWIWIYEDPGATPTNFFGYSYLENSWIWVRGDLGQYYIYRKGIWRDFEADR